MAELDRINRGAVPFDGIHVHVGGRHRIGDVESGLGELDRASVCRGVRRALQLALVGVHAAQVDRERGDAHHHRRDENHEDGGDAAPVAARAGNPRRYAQHPSCACDPLAFHYGMIEPPTVPEPIVRPPKSFVICRTAGPRITINSAGRIRNAIGMVIERSGCRFALRGLLALHPKRVSVNAEHLADARTEPLALNQVLDQNAELLDTRPGVGSTHRLLPGDASVHLPVDHQQLGRNIRVRVLHLLRDPEDGGIEPQPGLYTEHQQIHHVRQRPDEALLGSASSGRERGSA